VADRLFFQLCMASLFTVPLLFLITQVGNAGFGRYQLLTCFGLLLVASEIIALGLANRSWHRAIAVVALIALLIGCLTVTFGIATSRRGDPSGAITAMAEQARGGATILVGHDRDVAVIEAAAASAGYKVRIEETRCAGAQFLFLEQPDLSTLPHQISLCGLRYISIAERARTELSGMAWRLYQREQDQAGRRSSAARNTS
jgi:hypothetical protein